MHAATVRNPHGQTITVDADGRVVERDTVQCVHCGSHFEIIPGSKRRRTFCLLCMGLTCGRPECDPHIPFEARLDHMEGQKTKYDQLIVESGVPW